MPTVPTTIALVLLLAMALAAGLFVVPSVRERVLRRDRRTPGIGIGRQQQIAERLAGLGAWVHDLGDQRLHWSEGAFRLFGIDPMAGEPAPEAFVSAIDAADRQRWCDGRPVFTAFTTVLPPNSPSCIPTLDWWEWGIFTPSSNHDGGVNGLMGDGSVRMFTDQINTGDLSLPEVVAGPSPYGVWGAMGSRAGGELLREF